MVYCLTPRDNGCSRLSTSVLETKVNKSFLMILALVVALAGCSSNSGNRGKEVTLSYARVLQVERITKPSAVPAGVIVGGLTGLLLTRNSASTGKRAVGTLGGAAIGGALADSMNDRNAYQYLLEYRDGERSRFVTEKGFIRKGDCVAVERGQHSNLRRVESNLCTNKLPAEPPKELLASANQCHEAKDQLLQAKTDDEVTQASRKIRILCQYLQ